MLLLESAGKSCILHPGFASALPDGYTGNKTGVPTSKMVGRPPHHIGRRGDGRTIQIRSGGWCIAGEILKVRIKKSAPDAREFGVLSSSAVNFRALRSSHEERYRGPAMTKLTPTQLAERRRRREHDKIYREYAERFGHFLMVSLSAAVVRRMKASLKSGKDELAREKREQREQLKEQVKQSRREHKAFLLRPITAEMEREYTALIKRRQLYEGACDLSWAQYFKYREQHPDCASLSENDLAYAGMWTACAVAS
jgi:hypothetical protein